MHGYQISEVIVGLYAGEECGQILPTGVSNHIATRIWHSIQMLWCNWSLLRWLVLSLSALRSIDRAVLLELKLTDYLGPQLTPNWPYFEPLLSVVLESSCKHVLYSIIFCSSQLNPTQQTILRNSHTAHHGSGMVVYALQ